MCAASASPARAGGSGLTQRARLATPLAPSYVALEERDSAQRMAMARRYARLLAFVELGGDASGDWAPLLASDQSFLMAEIATCGAPDPATSDLPALAQLHGAARRIDSWYRQLEQHNAAFLAHAVNPLFTVLGSLIEQDLGPALAAALADPQLNGQWRALDAEAAPLASLWQLGAASASLSGAAAPLAGVLARFDEAIHQLGRLARERLALALDEADHPPHTGLYLAFLRLLDVLRADMNRFTGRYLDYYYRRVLAMEQQGAEGDSALLVLTLAPTCASYALAAGTPFKAGQDAAGKDIVYAADHAAALNQARVVATASLCLARPGAAADATDADAAVTQACAAPVANSQDGLGAPLQAPQNGWATFGQAPAAAALDASLGLLVTAPVLQLSEGQRQITLTLEFGADCQSQSAAYLAACGARAQLQQAFLVALSGAAGWQAVDDVVLCAGADANQWLLVLTLAAGAPAVVANPALVPGSVWPLLRLTLNPAASVYAYSYFADLRLASLNIAVVVSGLSGLQIANGGGPIAAGKPFAPFGNAPMPGQFLQLAHPELSAKAVSSATVTIDWINLPLSNPAPTPPATDAPAYGFDQYYAGYQPYVYNNTCFTVGVSAYDAGGWIALGQAPAPPVTTPAPVAPFALFNDPLTGSSTFAIDLSPLSWSAAAIAQPAPAIARATLQLSLAAPAYGFGGVIFPSLFAARAIESIKSAGDDDPGFWQNLRNWFRSLIGKPPMPVPAPVLMPNPPFVPMAKAVSLAYSASEQIALVALPGQPAQCYQVYPFGVAPTAATPPLYPSDGDDGQLYLGIANATPGAALGLYIALRDSGAGVVCLSRDQPAAAPQPVRWRYLDNNQWWDFPASSVSSATADFTDSGIVTLALPVAIDTGSTLMRACAPAGTFWIAACVARAPAAYSRTVAIYTQVVTVTRQLGDGATGVPDPLPPASIGGTLNPIIGIKSVLQPFASYGGRSAESDALYHARVSERLRHKGRASQLRDYEQLLLQAFPALWQVKAVGVNNSRRYHSAPLPAGQIVLVAVPASALAPELAAPLTQPQLGRIAAYAQSLGTAAITTVCARNVAYEALTVSVAVQFQAGADVFACCKQLNATLCAFLSPPAPYPTALAIGAGSVQVGQVAALVRAQSYVVQSGPVSIAQATLVGPADSVTFVEGQTVCSRAPWSVLVSAPLHSIVVADGPNAMAAAAPAAAAPVATDSAADSAAAPAYLLSIPFDDAQEAT